MKNKEKEKTLEEKATDKIQKDKTKKKEKLRQPPKEEKLPEDEKTNYKYWGAMVLLFGTFSTTFLFLTRNVTFEVSKNLIGVTALSIMFNVIVIGILVATGIGRKVLKRFKQRIMYATGRYMNTIICSKNGTMKEVFKKVDTETGSVRIDEKPYVRNPKVILNFERLPTYIHKEGNPEPVDIWGEDLGGNFSNSEMDIAMSSVGAFDVKEWLEKNKMFLIIVGGLMVAACGIAAYFGYSSFEMLRDGTYKAIKCLPLPQVIPPTG